MIGTIILYVLGGIVILGFIVAFGSSMFSAKFYERHPQMKSLGIPLFILIIFLWFFITAIPLALFDYYLNPSFLLLLIPALLWMSATICGAIWLLTKINKT